ncbi:MAG TPA: PAC2 family protein [Candidatus Hydrogenedentes bacterium]|nr:PAC2 family protein [Candidatus Hydrogenedentota bacterium]HQH51420.1 PAC2 family protein [Candidatus Hydrogenedentota bacterium]
MTHEALKMDRVPTLAGASMVIGLTGWMDGGEVSTGTVEYLIDLLDAQPFAEIDPSGFYIYNFPGSMEVSSLFRPHAVIEAGLVVAYHEPRNRFYVAEEHNLVLFEGKEPNLRWPDFADCMFALAAKCGVSRIVFIGSVAGIVPHTREPRLYGSVSDEKFRPLLDDLGLEPTDYEGPASLTTYLSALAGERDLQMTTVVAEIPAYVQERNVRCIEAVTRKVADMLGLALSLDELHEETVEFERRLAEIVGGKPELAALIRKMEQAYDKELTGSQMDDLKSWFEKQNIWLN